MALKDTLRYKKMYRTVEQQSANNRATQQYNISPVKIKRCNKAINTEEVSVFLKVCKNTPNVLFFCFSGSLS